MVDIASGLMCLGIGLTVTSSAGIMKILLENDLIPKVKKINNNDLKYKNANEDSNVVDIEYTILPQVFKKKNTVEHERRCADLIIKDILAKEKMKINKQEQALSTEVKNVVKKDSKYSKLAEEIFKDNNK